MTSSSIQFYSGSAGVEVLRLSKDGIWANPEIPADEAAKLVLKAIEYNINILVQKAIEDEREACAKVVEASPSYDWHRFACEAAAAIRARSNTNS